MKYKILIVSLLSTLAMPYGTTTAMACGRESRNENPHKLATEQEIAKHEEATLRIAEQDMPRVEDVITLVSINCQVGGKETVDFGQQFQTLTEAFNIQTRSLKKSLNNLTTLLNGTPGSDLVTHINYLSQEVNYLIQEVNEDKMTNQLLRQELEARKHEQAETNALLNDLLEQHLPLVHQPSLSQEIQTPSSALPSDTLSPVISPNLTPELPTGLSSYQQELFPRKHQIGDEAWRLLGGENASLAAALSNSIQQNSGMVDILSLEKNSFTLRLNGKEQYYPNKF